MKLNNKPLVSFSSTIPVPKGASDRAEMAIRAVASRFKARTNDTPASTFEILKLSQDGEHALSVGIRGDGFAVMGIHPIKLYGKGVLKRLLGAYRELIG